MGCARKLVFSWGGNPGVGSLHRFRDAVEHGWPRAARARGALPRRHGGRLRGGRREPAVRRAARLRRHRPAGPHAASRRSTARSPASELAAVRALRPDVGIIHAQQADRRGNVQLWGIIGVQKEAVLASRALDRDGRGDRATSSTRGRAAIVLPGVGDRRPSRVAPGGAHPSYAHGYYDRDNAFYVALGRDQPRPRDASPRGCSATCWRPRHRGVPRSCAREVRPAVTRQRTPPTR